MGRAPVRQRNNRSFRQWPNRETMITAGVLRAASKIAAVIPCRSATGANLASSADCPIPPADSNTVRMKNRPLPASPCWALSRMLHPDSARTLATSATMPMRSGHERVRTKIEWLMPSNARECGPMTRVRVVMRLFRILICRMRAGGGGRSAPPAYLLIRCSWNSLSPLVSRRRAASLDRPSRRPVCAMPWNSKISPSWCRP